MCLCSKQILPHRATKDIVCYKLFRKKTKKKKNGKVTIRYQSLYQCKYYYGQKELNVILHAKIEGHDKPFWAQPEKLTYVRSGYFHAHQIVKSDLILLYVSWCNIVLLKCIIPKGALYYKGVDGDICANQMIFVEEIDTD